ncbi:hypothetical protein [Martelella alba]|uniref:Uncharacterized protein n=1 Tax=Martelella alba TaxID=2590451 RepID=A0ABY2SQ23_9HYPH|nr:hypothetical protein [Martelella alba]TKI07545.1 hypothetical protein FCN80_06600 [Martelella alba]
MLLKAVIFSVSDVVLPTRSNPHSNEIKRTISKEFRKLLDFLESKNIHIIFLTNNNGTVFSDDEQIPLNEFLTQRHPNAKHYCRALNPGLPAKQSGRAIDFIMNDLNLERNKMIYVGRSDEDLQAATNGKVLFLNATWFKPVNEYGFLFSSPKEIARFIDIFCLRETAWGWQGNLNNAHYYALAPFSTYLADFSFYSENARSLSKLSIGTPDFWIRYLAASIFFSGLSNGAKYITTYVGHSSNNPYKLGGIMEHDLKGLAVAFKGKYLKDLFIRHTSADKSQNVRRQGGDVSITSQINTIHLNPAPIKNLNTGEHYVNPPNLRGAKVLVIDDFCTEGNAHETARMYLNAAGAEVVSISWLKTINRDVTVFEPNKRLAPWKPNTFSVEQVTPIGSIGYRTNLSGSEAPQELTTKIQRYDDWDWPKPLNN